MRSPHKSWHSVALSLSATCFIFFEGRIQSIQFVSPVFKACIIHSECSSQQSSGESSDSNDNWHEAEGKLGHVYAAVKIFLPCKKKSFLFE